MILKNAASQGYVRQIEIYNNANQSFKMLLDIFVLGKKNFFPITSNEKAHYDLLC